MSVPHLPDPLVGRNLNLFFVAGLTVVNTGLVSSRSWVIYFLRVVVVTVVAMGVAMIMLVMEMIIFTKGPKQKLVQVDFRWWLHLHHEDV